MQEYTQCQPDIIIYQLIEYMYTIVRPSLIINWSADYMTFFNYMCNIIKCLSTDNSKYKKLFDYTIKYKSYYDNGFSKNNKQDNKMFAIHILKIITQITNETTQITNENLSDIIKKIKIDYNINEICKENSLEFKIDPEFKIYFTYRLYLLSRSIVNHYCIFFTIFSIYSLDILPL